MTFLVFLNLCAISAGLGGNKAPRREEGADLRKTGQYREGRQRSALIQPCIFPDMAGEAILSNPKQSLT
jgi:hypothetical protein